jgi:hypothetical protein
MELEDVVGVKFGIENEVDMEEKGRGWDLEDIAGDSLSKHICKCNFFRSFCFRKKTLYEKSLLCYPQRSILSA